MKCGFKASSKPWKVSSSLFLFRLFVGLLLGDQTGRLTSVTKLPQVELDCKGGEEALIFKASRTQNMEVQKTEDRTSDASKRWKVVVTLCKLGCVGRSFFQRDLARMKKTQVI